MHPRPVRFVVAVSVTAGTTVALLASGCGVHPRPSTANPAGTPTSVALEPRAQLSARVAIAKDRRYVAAYALTQKGKPTRTILVTVATDATWRVDIQGGALGGTADVSIAGRDDGQYQCSVVAGCVKLAAKGGKLPAAADPRLHYPFTAWLDLLTDRQVAISVAPAAALPGSTGDCFSVEPTSAAMQPVIDSSVVCYSADGVLTAVQAAFGSLTLTAAPSAAPATVALPGPITGAAPLPTAPPPPPSVTATAAPTATRSQTARPTATSKKP